MKLPTRISTGVQSLGRNDVNAPIRTANAIAGAARAVSGAVDGYVQQRKAKRDESELRSARLNMSNSMVEFEEKYGQSETIPLDQVPESVDIKRTEKVTDENGSIIERERVDAPRHEVYPALYKHWSKANAEAHASNISDETLRSRFLGDVGIQSNSVYVQKLNASTADAERFEQQNLAANIDDQESRGNYDIAIQLAQDISNPEARAKTVNMLQRNQEIEGYSALLNSPTDDMEVVKDMEVVLDRLRNDENMQTFLTEKERSAFANQFEAATERNYASVAATEQRNVQETISNTWVGIDREDPSINEATVDALFDKDVIDGNTRTGMYRALNNNRARQLDSYLINIDLDAVALAPHGIDPKNKDQRKAVNARFDDYTQSMDKGEAATKIMQEFKVVPDQIQSIFRANNRADASGLTQAAEMYSQAIKYAPQAMKDLTKDDTDVVAMVSANIDLGMSAPDAIAAVKSYETLTPQQKETLRKESPVFVAANVEKLADMMGESPNYKGGGVMGFFESTPDVVPMMQADFDTAVQRHLPSVGFNLAVAQRMAFGDVSKSWARTEINGEPQLMQNPPMGPIENVRAQISSQYKGQLGALSAEFDKRFTFEDIKVTSNTLTALDVREGRLPRYQAYLITDNGTQEMVLLDNFVWDGEAAAEARKAELKAKGAKYREQVKRFQDTTGDGFNSGILGGEIRL